MWVAGIKLCDPSLARAILSALETSLHGKALYKCSVFNFFFNFKLKTSVRTAKLSERTLITAKQLVDLSLPNVDPAINATLLYPGVDLDSSCFSLRSLVLITACRSVTIRDY